MQMHWLFLVYVHLVLWLQVVRGTSLRHECLVQQRQKPQLNLLRHMCLVTPLDPALNDGVAASATDFAEISCLS